MRNLLLMIQKPFLYAHKSPGINRFFEILDMIIAGINKNVAVLGLVFGIVITAINVCSSDPPPSVLGKPGLSPAHPFFSNRRN